MQNQLRQSMSNGARRMNLRSIKKNRIGEIMQRPAVKPTRGFGLTITNKRIGLMLWDRAFTFDWPTFPWNKK